MVATRLTTALAGGLVLMFAGDAARNAYSHRRLRHASDAMPAHMSTTGQRCAHAAGTLEAQHDGLEHHRFAQARPTYAIYERAPESDEITDSIFHATGVPDLVAEAECNKTLLGAESPTTGSLICVLDRTTVRRVAGQSAARRPRIDVASMPCPYPRSPT